MSDHQVITLMDALIANFTSGSYEINIGNIRAINVEKAEDSGAFVEGLDTYGKLLTENSYLITDAEWSVSEQKVSYYRGKAVQIGTNGVEAWVPAPNPYIDGLDVRASEKHAVRIFKTVSEYVAMAPPILARSETSDAFDQSQAILNRVSAAIATLVEHTADRQKELDKTRASLAVDAAEAIREGKADAEAEVKEIQRSFSDKERLLIEREADLDDRANTHARREFAKQMASLSDIGLASNLLSKSQRSFWVPIAICVIPILVLCTLIWREINYIELFSKNINALVTDAMLSAQQKATLVGNVNYQILYAQIRIAVQSVGIAALVWFALRMASARYSLVSGWERDLHRFRLDTERAGFLVEGDLEARKVNQEGLPDVLLESFSRNLFASSDGGHGPSSSEGLGGALNALLGQAAKVRVGPDGVNVEIEGKGIRKARKLIEEE